MVKRSDNANGLLPTIVIEGNARFQIEVNKNKNVPLTGRPRWRTAWVRVTRRAGEAQETSSAEAKAVCGAGAGKAGGRDSVTEEPLTPCLRVETFSSGTGRPPEEFERGKIRLEFQKSNCGSIVEDALGRGELGDESTRGCCSKSLGSESQK